MPTCLGKRLLARDDVDYPLDFRRQFWRFGPRLSVSVAVLFSSVDPRRFCRMWGPRISLAGGLLKGITSSSAPSLSRALHTSYKQFVSQQAYDLLFRLKPECCYTKSDRDLQRVWCCYEQTSTTFNQCFFLC